MLVENSANAANAGNGLAHSEHLQFQFGRHAWR
jgi:hypothetical protein